MVEEVIESPKWLGIAIDKWVALMQSVGIPTLFMLFVCFMAWRYVPPIVNGHVELLRRTGDTLESMDNTLQRSNAMIAEMLSVERRSEAFMDQVHDEHMQAVSGQQEILRAVSGGE